jgi:hypothetical protein
MVDHYLGSGRWEVVPEEVSKVYGYMARVNKKAA